jgi:hypothetical protein
MNPKDIALLAVTIPLFLAFTVFIVVCTIALYFDVIRPHLAERECRKEKKPITGIHFMVDVERAGGVKAERDSEMPYRR